MNRLASTLLALLLACSLLTRALQASDAASAVDSIARLKAELEQLRSDKAAFAKDAAAERQRAMDQISALENTEAARRKAIKELQTQLAKQTAEQDQLKDALQLEQERQTVFLQGLQSSAEQLLQRIDGSLESAAHPALRKHTDELRQGSNDPTALLQTVLDTDAQLLAAARSVASFQMRVKLEDGSIVPAQCLQISLLGGYFYDPASQQAGLLVGDNQRSGQWRGQSKGLSNDQKLAIAARIQSPGTAGLLPVDVSGGAALIQATHQWNLQEWFEAGGVVMWPLLAVLIAGLILVTERTVALLRLSWRTRDLLEQVEAALAARRFDEAQTLCDPARGPVQRVLHAALIHRTQSRTVIEDALQSAALGEMPHLQKGLGMIALLAGVAPLLGLLGTVTGMIHTFQMVNLFGSSDTRFLAGGISEALITTEFGLVMAIPMVFCHGILMRLSEKILTSIELGAAIVVQRLSTTTTGAATPAATIAATSPAPVRAATEVVSGD